jgi:anti-sigma factor (TIGR02949 family)
MSPLDRLTCEEMFRRLDDYVDRELAPAEVVRVREHLETCAACADEYAFHTAMLEEVRGRLRRIDVPADLLSRALARIATARREEGGGGRASP